MQDLVQIKEKYLQRMKPMGSARTIGTRKAVARIAEDRLSQGRRGTYALVF